MVGNCPVGDRLAQPCPSLGAFCFPRLPGGAEQGKLAPPGCCAMPSRFGAAGPARQGREGRELLTEGLSGGASVWGERAGPCLPPQGWAGHGSGRQWVCSTRPVGLCRGGLPQRPLVLPPPPPQPSRVTWGLAMRVLAAPCLLAYALLIRNMAAELTPPGLALQGFRHAGQAGKHQLPTQSSWVLTQQGGRLRAQTGS